MRPASVIIALVLLSACNPHQDELPAALCRSSTYDCRPGEVCHEGRCAAERSARLVIGAAPGRAVHAWILADPDRDPLRSERSRRLAVARPTDEPSELRARGLPRLPSFALVWAGGPDGPCEGDAYALSSLPDQLHAELRLALIDRWDRPCLSAPPALTHQDRIHLADRSLSQPTRSGCQR